MEEPSIDFCHDEQAQPMRELSEKVKSLAIQDPREQDTSNEDDLDPEAPVYDGNGELKFGRGPFIEEFSDTEDSEDEGLLVEERVRASLYPEYELLEEAGEGGFSKVYKGVHRPSKRIVAIKVIDKRNLSSKQLYSVLNEIKLLEEMDHPNIISLRQLFDKNNFCFLIMEYCDGGEIFNKIIEYTYFSEQLARHVFVQLLLAVEYLHKKHIVHRDIKPENLLFRAIPYRPRTWEEFEKSKRASDDGTKVDEGQFVEGEGGGAIGIIKLADFGLSKQFVPNNSSNESLKTPCGTAGYTAPEVIACNKPGADGMLMEGIQSYSKSVDIWSLGCFLYTVLCGFPPFYDDDPDKLIYKITGGDYVFLKPWWDEISDDAKDLVSKMLIIDPKKRITIEQLWKHPWLKHHVKDKSPSYFSSGDSNHAEYFPEMSDFDTLKPPAPGKLPKTPMGALSPRADAIKKVFNNVTMTNITNKGHEAQKVNHKNGPRRSKNALPSVQPELVFKKNYTLEVANDVEKAELSDELTSLDFGKRNEDGVRISLSSNLSSSDDDNFGSDGVGDEYQTRASSINSIANGDRINLNLNSSHLLRRRSTKSSRSTVHEI